ncbi:glycerol-3-phosphate acyltransferase 1-like [Zingiber officinale]|uniref:glycerol-3-phosphate acyltransferase 1-like n=1 Tax=Zingiber officinale TaxID=94328 RepID=UPI001C4AF077|nr:glycerol-3-phosphate acyltransferase 1-like [Zingiber officinale]
MAFVTFCGLRTGDLRLIARTVLPKIFLENLHLHACEVLKGRRAVVLTTLPRLVVEGFLKEYLEVGEVVGAELQVVKGCYFTGVISWPDKQRALKDMVKAGATIVNLSNVHHHQLSAKEIYVVREEESRSESSKMPRNKYPKPLVFHDRRLAFLPTPCEMMAFFMWIPVAIPLAVFRIAMGIVFPYKISIFIAVVTGIRFRRAGDGKANGEKKGVVYVCTHRTLLDPVMLCSALERTVPAVTYSLSRVSEALAPMRTVRLTWDRGRDAATMRRLLAVEGGLAVCPEGTTCREPYLLRFSPLFAEVAEEVVPVALDARVGMLCHAYGHPLESYNSEPAEKRSSGHADLCIMRYTIPSSHLSFLPPRVRMEGGEERNMEGAEQQQQEEESDPTEEVAGDKSKKKKQPIKVVYISNPMKVKATDDEFRSVVQGLTGRDSDLESTLSKYGDDGEGKSIVKFCKI